MLPSTNKEDIIITINAKSSIFKMTVDGLFEFDMTLTLNGKKHQKYSLHT